MPSVRIDVDATHAIARLDAIMPDVRQALRAALPPLVASLLGATRSLAAAHIRFLGKDPGAYLSSISGGVSDRQDQVIGYVRSGSPLAHLLEFGAHPPPHEILPSAAQALAFLGDAGTVFAKAVHSPGAVIPPYPAIDPPFAAASDEIEEALTKAVKQAAGGS